MKRELNESVPNVPTPAIVCSSWKVLRNVPWILQHKGDHCCPSKGVLGAGEESEEEADTLLPAKGVKQARGEPNRIKVHLSSQVKGGVDTQDSLVQT